MDKQRLMKVLGKYTKKDLPTVFKHLGLESSFENLKGRNKRETISSLIDSCTKAKVSNTEILGLELSYAVSHCNSLTWKAYRLEKLDPTCTPLAELDSRIFSKRLQLYLGDIFTFDMTDELSPSGHYWLCLHITGGGTLPYTCFILRSPSLPFLYLAGVRKAHLVPLLEVLCLTLDCVGCVDLELSGRNLDSIISMTTDQYGQGPYAQYRLNEVDPNPLLAVAKRRCFHDLRDKQKDDRLSSQDREKRKAVKEAFGTHPLPKLERFVFKINVDLPDETDSINCKVKFTGSNVLEGIKECVMTDCVSLPVPESFKHMPHCSTNVISIVESHDKTASHTRKNSTETAGKG